MITFLNVQELDRTHEDMLHHMFAVPASFLDIFSGKPTPGLLLSLECVFRVLVWKLTPRTCCLII